MPIVRIRIRFKKTLIITLWKKLFKIFSILPDRNRKVMMDADIPSQHKDQHITHIMIQLFHRIRKFIPCYAFRNIIQTPVKLAATIGKYFMIRPFHIPEILFFLNFRKVAVLVQKHDGRFSVIYIWIRGDLQINPVPIRKYHQIDVAAVMIRRDQLHALRFLHERRHPKLFLDPCHVIPIRLHIPDKVNNIKILIDISWAVFIGT